MQPTRMCLPTSSSILQNKNIPATITVGAAILKMNVADDDLQKRPRGGIKQHRQDDLTLLGLKSSSSSSLIQRSAMSPDGCFLTSPPQSKRRHSMNERWSTRDTTPLLDKCSGRWQSPVSSSRALVMPSLRRRQHSPPDDVPTADVLPAAPALSNKTIIKSPLPRSSLTLRGRGVRSAPQSLGNDDDDDDDVLVVVPRLPLQQGTCSTTTTTTTKMDRWTASPRAASSSSSKARVILPNYPTRLLVLPYRKEKTSPRNWLPANKATTPSATDLLLEGDVDEDDDDLSNSRSSNDESSKCSLSTTATLQPTPPGSGSMMLLTRKTIDKGDDGYDVPKAPSSDTTSPTCSNDSSSQCRSCCRKYYREERTAEEDEATLMDHHCISATRRSSAPRPRQYSNQSQQNSCSSSSPRAGRSVMRMRSGLEHYSRRSDVPRPRQYSNQSHDSSPAGGSSVRLGIVLDHYSRKSAAPRPRHHSNPPSQGGGSFAGAGNGTRSGFLEHNCQARRSAALRPRQYSCQSKDSADTSSTGRLSRPRSSSKPSTPSWGALTERSASLRREQVMNNARLRSMKSREEPANEATKSEEDSTGPRRNDFPREIFVICSPPTNNDIYSTF